MEYVFIVVCVSVLLALKYFVSIVFHLFMVLIAANLVL